MKMLLLEDEAATVRLILGTLQDSFPEVDVIKTISTVEEAVKWIPANRDQFDLALMDIRLSDGLSLDIFQQIQITQPVIFLTAYDHFALQAFQTSGISYLLKPLDVDQLRLALEKYKSLKQSSPNHSMDQIAHVVQNLLAPKGYRQAFLVHVKGRMIPVKTENIAYFWSEQEVCHAKTFQGQTYILESTLEKLEQELNPEQFYRANRQYFVNLQAIQEVHYYFNGRLSLTLDPDTEDRVLVSKAKSTAFKAWMNK